MEKRPQIYTCYVKEEPRTAEDISNTGRNDYNDPESNQGMKFLIPGANGS